MNSDFDINVHSGDDSHQEESRSRFLESLGVSDSDHSDSADEVMTDSLEEEGDDESLILSSGPDDLELPGAGESIPDRFSGFTSMEETERPPALPAARKTPEAPAVLTAAAPVDLDEVLELSCPECSGELVLKRRHIGIEGACVWCHASIIAAESPRDGVIRVFPILGHQMPKPAEPTKETAASPPALSEEEPAATEPVSETAESSPEIALEGPAMESPAEPAAVVEEAAPTMSFGGFLEIPPAQNSPFPEGPSFTAEEFISPKEPTPDPEKVSPPAASATHISPISLMEPEKASPLDKTDEAQIPTGFGAFLSGSHVAAEDLNAAPSFPPGFSGEPLPLPTGPETPDLASFQSPTLWGPPTKIPVDAAATQPSEVVSPAAPVPSRVKDETPVALPNDPIAGFATAFAPRSNVAPGGEPEVAGAEHFAAVPWMTSPETSEPEVESFQPTAGSSTLDDFAAAFASSGFGLSPEKTTTTAPSDAPTPQGFESLPVMEAEATSGSDSSESAEEAPANEFGFSFHNSPSSQTLFGNDASTEKRTFALPGNGFSTGSSSHEDLSKSPAPDTEKSTPWGISEPIGFSESDVAPGSLPIAATPAAPTENLFSDAPVPAIPRSHPPALPAEAPASSFIPAEVPAPTPASGFTATQPGIQEPEKAAFTPTVISQPLGTKPKAKVRKGFIVLMVIIVGFASGAALASFVLPIDEYVQTARAYMEQKFSLGSVVQQLPAADAPSYEAAPEENNDSQP